MAKRDPNVLLDPYADAPAPDSAGPPSSEAGAEGVAPPARQESSTDLGQRPAPLPPPQPPPRRAPEEPAPPTLPARRRKRRGLALVVGTLIAGTIAGGGYAGYRYFGQKTAPMFPDAKLAFLPESTVLVQRMTREQLVTDSMFLKPNEQALWSHMAASSCGGTDVYEQLMSAKLEVSKQVLTAAFDIRHDTAKALTCGREMANRLGSTLYFVRMEGEREIRREPERLRRYRDEPPEDPGPQKAPLLSVTLYDFGRGDLPATTEGFIERRDRSGLSNTRCAVESGRRFADCWSGSWASAKLEGSSLWVSGRVAEIEAFGREFSPKASNTLEEAKQFEALALEVEKFPSAQIGKWTAFDVSFIRRIGCGAPFTSWDSTPFNVKLSEAVTKFKSIWSIGDSLGIGGGEMRLFFLPETEGEAVDLVLDLKDWHDGAKEFFDKLEEPDMGGSEEVKTTEREYRTAIHKSCVRSLGNASVDRAGKLVTLSFTSDIEPGEKDAIDDMIRDVEDRRKAASKIIDQLIAGERPDFDLLDELGGKELVDAVKHKNQPAKPEF